MCRVFLISEEQHILGQAERLSQSGGLKFSISHTFEFSAVVALFSKVSLSLSSTGCAMLVRTSIPLSRAFWNDSEMMVGWIPVGNTKRLLDTHAFKPMVFIVFSSPSLSILRLQTLMSE